LLPSRGLLKWCMNINDGFKTIQKIFEYDSILNNMSNLTSQTGIGGLH